MYRPNENSPPNVRLLMPPYPYSGPRFRSDEYGPVYNREQRIPDSHEWPLPIPMDQIEYPTPSSPPSKRFSSSSMNADFSRARRNSQENEDCVPNSWEDWRHVLSSTFLNAVIPKMEAGHLSVTLDLQNSADGSDPRPFRIRWWLSESFNPDEFDILPKGLPRDLKAFQKNLIDMWRIQQQKKRLGADRVSRL